MIAILLGVAVALDVASVAGAEPTGPTAVLDENCFKVDDGAQVYGVRLGVTGFPSGAEFTGTLDAQYIDPPVNPDGSYSTGYSIGPATLATNVDGEFIQYLGTVGVQTIFTLTVDSPYLGGTVTKTLTVTCEGPSTGVAQGTIYRADGSIYTPGSLPETPQESISGAPIGGPQVDVRRVVWPKTIAKLLSRGVRARAGCDQACQVTATVSLKKAVPGIARGEVIARGVEGTGAGQADWVTAKVVRSARKALLGPAADVDLAPRLRVTATTG